MPMNTICTNLMVSGHGVTIKAVCFARPMLCISLVIIMSITCTIIIIVIIIAIKAVVDVQAE